MQNESLLHKIKQGINDMCYIWAKEMRSTFRDEGVLIFFIFVPLLYPLLYSWIYNNEVVHKVPIAIVDKSHSETSREIIRSFNASPNTKVEAFCNNIEEAQILVGKQIVHGIIYLPEDLETNIFRKEQSHISVYCDMSLMLTYKAIFQTAQAIASNYNERIQLSHSLNFTKEDEEATTQPLAFDEVAIFNDTGGYGNFIIPAVLMLIIQQTLLLGIGLGAGTARENNRYKDLVPISRHYAGIFRIVLGKSMCYFMIFAIMSTYLTLVIPHLFNFISIPEAASLLGILFPYLLACIFFGMMFSCLVRYRENVLLLVVFTSVPFLFLSGVSWPQSNIPSAWQGIATLIPSTFGVRAFTRISTMGGSLNDVRTEYIALWIQTLVYFFATCLVYRYQINQARKHANEHIETLKNQLSKAKEKRTKEKDTMQV